MAYDSAQLEQQKKTVFTVDLNNQESMMDFIEEFNNFNENISNSDAIFEVIEEYYRVPKHRIGTVKYDSGKGHFVIEIHAMNGGGKKKRKTRRKHSALSKKRSRNTHSKRKSRSIKK